MSEDTLPDPQPTPNTETLTTAQERRRSRRIGLRLELQVPVEVTLNSRVIRGVARNLSEGGMLVELPEAPPIGARVGVIFAGIQGSVASPDAVEIKGEVRHHMSWNFSDGERNMKGVGVRFVEEVEERSASSWVFRTGCTIH